MVDLCKGNEDLLVFDCFLIILLQFSDVEKGGATVFPARGGYVKPTKGGAAFWHNLYASGEGIIPLLLPSIHSFSLFR